MLIELFWTFFKIGAFTFGGGYAMLPMVTQEVAAHGWMSDAELVNFIAVSESTPGPFAVNVSTYVGTHTAGVAGACAATLGVVLPSFLIILAIAGAYKKFERSRIVKGVMSGLRPAVVGLIGAAILTVGKTVFFPEGTSLVAMQNAAFWISAGIFAFAAFCSLRKGVHPIKIIVASAGVGLAAGYIGLI